jgi:hypothetical protein
MYIQPFYLLGTIMSDDEKKRDTRKPSLLKRAKKKVKSIITFPRLFKILLWLLLDDSSDS